MKLLVFSDTHGDELAFFDMIEKEKNYDALYCAGDSGFSMSFLTNNNIISVKGNYPFGPNLPLEIIKEIQGHTLYLTHGHVYGVKFGLKRLIKQAKDLSASICIFGHTHKAYLESKQGIYFLNPGALSYSKSSQNPSYARIILTETVITIEIIDLLNQTTIQSV